jgi:ABC-type amino acid transport substrate-binding protein
VLAGSTSHEALSGISVEIVYAQNTDELYQDVESGKTKGAVTATARVLLTLQDFDDLDISLYLGEREEFGFAFAKDSPLSASLSEHIAKIKSSGIYFRLLETYLGSKAAAIVQAGSC